MKETKKQKQTNKIATNQKITVGAGLVSAQRISNKGITLIALVITIIVLLILASVAINLTLGDNGIFTKAQEARDKMERASLIERIQTEILEKQLVNEETNINKGDLETILSKHGDPQKDGEGNITGVKPEGKEIIPIEDIIGNNKITEEAVKVPPYNIPYIPNGFTHIGTEDWNSGYTIKGNKEEGIAEDEFVWVPCVLTEEEQQAAKTNNGHGLQIFQKTTTGKYNSFNLGLLPTDTTVEAEDTSVQAIEESVGKYGGFYIAKYEAGIEGTTANYDLPSTDRKPTNGDYKPLSQAGKGVWSGITRANAITVSKAMIDHEVTGVYSTLISGAAWDTTLQWMVNSKEENKGYDTWSKGKGWFTDVSGDKVRTTGYFPVNNIYDMAGNIAEWTTENCTRNNRKYIVGRGRILPR